MKFVASMWLLVVGSCKVKLWAVYSQSSEFVERAAEKSIEKYQNMLSMYIVSEKLNSSYFCVYRLFSFNITSLSLHAFSSAA